jgi:anaerobic ribonucleoside-triphosphate reductase activating protein
VKVHHTYLEINKAHFPVTVLGPGRRIGLWVQGCSIGCKGCVSMDTWNADLRKRVTVDDLLSWCKKVGKAGFDGVTISGGEPFDQAPALAVLLRRMREWRRTEGLDFDILCYSGYPLKSLQSKHANVLALLDAVIPEPFIESLLPASIWRGSSNQALVPLSDLGHRRFDVYLNKELVDRDKKIQLAVENGRIWMIGIPARGDMEKVEALCNSRGLSLKDVSWRR